VWVDDTPAPKAGEAVAREARVRLRGEAQPTLNGVVYAVFPVLVPVGNRPA